MATLPLACRADAAEPAGDALLVQEAQRQPAAFAELYRRYVGPMHRYVYSRTGSRADAEDLTAEVFAQALAALPAYRERGLFAAWLFSIARRVVAGHFRRNGSHPVAPLDTAEEHAGRDPDPLAAALQGEALAELAARLARMDEDSRELLRLRYAAGLTYREIGEVVGKREAAVKMAVHRLLGRLRETWEGDDAR